MGASASQPSARSLLRAVGASCAAFFAGIVAAALYGVVVSLLPATVTQDPAAIPFIVFLGVGTFFAAAISVAMVILDGGRPRFTPAAFPVFPRADSDATCTSAIALIRQPPATATRNAWLTLAGTFLLFLAWFGAGNPAVSVVVLSATLFFHEGGHWLAMRAFGYQDSRIFFVPFFGAATSGKKVGAPGWQECTVLLMGPLPGLLLAVALLLLTPVHTTLWLRSLVRALVLINLLNLLPLAGLDGGRILTRVIFSRRPLLESIADALMGAGLVALGWKLGAWFLMAIGVFSVFMVRVRHRIAVAAADLRRRTASIPIDIGTASNDYLADLYTSISVAFDHRPMKPAAATGWMQNLHERLLAEPMSAGATLVFLALYFVSALVGLVGIALLIPH